jgi:hypothetical protein
MCLQLLFLAILWPSYYCDIRRMFTNFDSAVVVGWQDKQPILMCRTCYDATIVTVQEADRKQTTKIQTCRFIARTHKENGHCGLCRPLCFKLSQ